MRFASIVLSMTEGQGVAAGGGEVSCASRTALVGRLRGWRRRCADDRAARRAWCSSHGSIGSSSRLRGWTRHSRPRLVRRPDQLQRSDQQDHRLVAAPGDERLVKPAGVRHVPPDVIELLGLDRDLGLEVRAPPRSTGHRVPRTSPRRSVPGQSAPADVGRCRRPRLQHHADHVRGPLGRRLMDDRSADVAAAHRDQAVEFRGCESPRAARAGSHRTPKAGSPATAACRLP